VPFAEYFPLRLDVMRRRFGRVRVFEHGEETAPIPTRAGPAGVLVCNEAMLPEVAAARVARGAVYLVNPSNDTWIDDPQYTEQQFDIASLRAIEQRRYLVRASTAGPSAVIDPLGRVLARTRALESGLALGEVRAVEEVSVYGRVGDLFGGLCAAAVAAALVLRRPRAD
jgi:apolipoprotein N-acyltransferase